MPKLIIETEVYRRLLMFLLSNQNVSAKELLYIMRRLCNERFIQP